MQLHCSVLFVMTSNPKHRSSKSQTKTSQSPDTPEYNQIGRSKVTERHQTTIPVAVRSFLGLSPRDDIQYSLAPDGQHIIIEKAVPDDDGSDPLVEVYLDFLEKTVVNDPGLLKPLDEDFILQALELAEGVEYDLDAPLEDG